MRKWPTQVSTVVANVGRELPLLKMAIDMANADYPTFFQWNELEPRCQQRAAGFLELIQLMTGEPRPRYSALHLLGESGAYAHYRHTMTRQWGQHVTSLLQVQSMSCLPSAFQDPILCAIIELTEYYDLPHFNEARIYKTPNRRLVHNTFLSKCQHFASTPHIYSTISGVPAINPILRYSS